MARLALIAALVLAGSPALACPGPPAPAEFAIYHERYGEVGRHVIAFSCAGDDLVVETTLEGEVKILMVPLFRRQGAYREVWRGDRLIAFDSRVVDNGEAYEVRARADGEHTVIEGRRGRIEAPATIVPDHHWNHDVVERRLLFDVRRGRLRQVEVAAAGTDILEIAGQKVAARKYRLSGDLERELWYDAAGNWLQARLVVDGATITMIRQSPVPGPGS